MNVLTGDKGRHRMFSILEIALIVLLAIVPLFLSFPYRVNIFLSWEGAYRLSEGQIPYKDFGMPLGYMYWVIPSLFFKVFGPQMITLVKAQVLINIISGFAFRSILKNIGIEPGIRLLSVLLYCISFSFFNFWPWYNHTVIVYEMAGLAFLTYYIFRSQRWYWLSLSALFVFFSFFTKQDGGGLALVLCLALLIYHCWAEKKWLPLLLFTGSFAIALFAIIMPLTRFNFGYWFNHGQAPHTSRISGFEIIDDFFTNSQWIKFYIFIILLLMLASFKNFRSLVTNKRDAFLLLLTFGILAEAAILQVTSYTPPDNNIFFHSFAFACILSFLARLINLNFSNYKTLFVGAFGLFLWWSGVFWKYIQRIVERGAGVEQVATAGTNGENIVNRKTYMIDRDTADLPMSQWVYSNLPAFKKIYMPQPTVDGINRLMAAPYVKDRKDLRVLNMTELTPLAVEIPFRLETGPDIPLWNHLGVAMFNKEAAMFEEKIKNKAYDLVLFEYIPTLNNFYPFRVRDSLHVHYIKTDSFPAPRRGETKGMIEVFVPAQ